MTKSSDKTTARCIYKPDSQSVVEYIAIISDANAAKAWKEGDKTIPLIDIVDSFDVFTTGQGKQGLLERPSKQILESVFETTKSEEIITQLLEKGTIQEGKAVSDSYSSRKESGLSRGATGGGR